MTREEEILRTAGDYHKSPTICAAFVDGARWADENPQSPWISVENDLPCNHEEFIIKGTGITKEVLVLLEDKEINNLSSKTMSMIFDDATWEWVWEINYWIYNCRVTHWMYIPEIPKE